MLHLRRSLRACSCRGCVSRYLKSLGIDENDVVVGHSSGAVALTRLCEDVRVRALVLVATCWTDQGQAYDRAHGYYSRPWRWDRIKANCGTVLQFHSASDSSSPKEAREIAGWLGSAYHDLPEKGHYQHRTQPEVLAGILALPPLEPAPTRGSRE